MLGRVVAEGFDLF